PIHDVNAPPTYTSTMPIEPPRLASLENPRVKEAVRLRRRPAREEQGLFLVEGEREIRRALEAKFRAQTLFICEEIAGAGAERNWSLRAPGANIFTVTQPVYEKMAMREERDGIVAIFEIPHTDPQAWKLPADALVMVAVGIEKPGNLGALARSADAFGVNGLIVSGGTDLWNPNTVRASLGSIFTIPVAVMETERIVPELHALGLRLTAATPAGETVLDDASWDGKIALLVGSEERGLPAEILRAVDVRVRIPMQGSVDSLNVSVTAGILLHEAHRRRRRGAP
ncbi:MAG TPA: RNA methyltransferase, partial [bacterium]|nr:RNA methyltransferase [bacterium]